MVERPEGDSEATELFRAAVRQFVANEVIPREEELDQDGEFPFELFRRLGALGYLGIRYPEEVGGQGAGLATACVLWEELAYGNLAIAAICAMQGLMGTEFVYRYGTDAHRANYLEPALRGEKVATFALTEPNAGSDLGAIQTRAEKVDGGWVINGSKTWISNAPVADFLTVGARTSDEPGMKNIALFFLDATTEGFEVGKPIKKLGVRSSLTSEVMLDGCFVPDDALLGDVGDGARIVGGILSEIRTMTAALSVGLGRRARDVAAEYANQREAFGSKIGDFQAIQHKLADMETELFAASVLTNEVARRVEAGTATVRETAMAKLFASEVCVKAVDETTRIFGSYGFAMEYPAQRYFRDARFLLYGGGTSEILRMIIGRDVLRAHAS